MIENQARSKHLFPILLKSFHLLIAKDKRDPLSSQRTLGSLISFICDNPCEISHLYIYLVIRNNLLFLTLSNNTFHFTDENIIHDTLRLPLPSILFFFTHLIEFNLISKSREKNIRGCRRKLAVETKKFVGNEISSCFNARQASAHASFRVGYRGSPGSEKKTPVRSVINRRSRRG